MRAGTVIINNAMARLLPENRTSATRCRTTTILATTNSSSSLASVHDDNSNDEAVSTSDDDDDGSGQDEPPSDSPPKNVVERKHAAVNRKSSGKPQKKSLLGNILSFVSRKRKVIDDGKARLVFCPVVFSPSIDYLIDFRHADLFIGSAAFAHPWLLMWDASAFTVSFIIHQSPPTRDAHMGRPAWPDAASH
jgi:hypothetical protein